MKKITITLLMLAAIATLNSCDLKSCYCCVSTGEVVHEEESYTEDDKSCSTLNNSKQICMERHERIPGCEGVAVSYKNKH